MNARVFETASEEETLALGRALACEFAPGAVVLLIGELGAGKTTLAKGIVEGLAAASADDVASPTFTLIHEYGGAGRPKVYHIDLYRLDEVPQAAALGLDEIFDSGAVVLLEWAERFPKLLPPRRIEIRITPAAEPESRRFEVLALDDDTRPGGESHAGLGR